LTSVIIFRSKTELYHINTTPGY